MQTSLPLPWILPPVSLLALVWGFNALCSLLVCYHCLRHRREPVSAILWIFLAWSFPLLGPLLYLGFGVDRVPRKGWRKHAHDQAFLAERRAREEEAFPLAYWRAMYDMVAAEPPGELGHGIDRAMDAILPDFPLLGGNRIRTLVDATETFPAMLDAIRSARHHIHLHPSTPRGFPRLPPQCRYQAQVIQHGRAQQ